ncbi:GNAT family N-acetyltransferase [Clostridium estertheticum]|uniref:GNAT family N-acetyltransferase n=1 Tax=Clostridium estertheticum TaxID=238834 RepID=UPI001C0E0072|nr:GNAT family N-acetyltransferase [Clostridium estertheticum]MBU3202492.1 GNAT family N-acetyltransferase [Clostridium estertheticum]WAG63447.1 GNAT family N-acetyltransferase [Clostridium estertheticum]
MDIIFDLGKENDIDELEQLYNGLNDHLAKGVNFPGWKKDVYPVRQNAIDGVKNGNLYVAKYNGKIIGSVILSHEPESAYYNAKWKFESDYSDVFVIHTFVVHSEFLKCGVGKALMDFSIEHSIMSQAKSIRLDVYEGNIPAISLYEKCGFKYVDTVDLGLGNYGLNWFRLYEKLL